MLSTTNNGKQVGEESFSIQSNYLGTPEVMYDADGKVVWGAELSSYGDVRNLTGERTDCPFRYQGQYEDKETGLYYNRFRYYSAEEGMYISQDPIGLQAGDNLYGYIDDSNFWIDPLGLAKSPNQQQGDDGRDALLERLKKSSRFEVIDKEVRINTPGHGEKTYRKADILVYDTKTQEIIAIEVKTGGASRDDVQISKDKEIAAGKETTWGTKKVNDKYNLKKGDRTGKIRTIEVLVDEKTGKIKKSSCTQ